MYEPAIVLHNAQHDDPILFPMHQSPPHKPKNHPAIPPIVPLNIPQPRHHHPQPQQQQPPPPHPTRQGTHQSADSNNAPDRVTVTAIPSITIVDGEIRVGNDHSTSVRSYTPLKKVGDGSFGTVLLCDWHSPLPPNTQLSPMQRGPARGPGAHPEWQGKRLVAVKRMKKRWEGGWAECKQLKELESLRVIPPHENIIPLYDYFLLPSTKELYFVFESMEGNLYQLIKARRERPFAGGLIASIYRQIVSGLKHIHQWGYFHRDMKPENLLVTTIGLADYSPTSPFAQQPPSSAPPDKDVMVIVKLADFGLARETKSSPPYTEYVSTRWYRAPEVLLRSRDYSNPVDMWALGTILAELVNLKPIFPGQNEMDQVVKITEVLGDPSDAYGFDHRNRAIGGGKWTRGLRMAHGVGYTFPKVQPMAFRPLFANSVPDSLVDCIADLLRYDPKLRLTAQQCMDHPYWRETEHSQRQPIPAFPPAQSQPSHHAHGHSHRHHPPNTNASNTSSNKSLRTAVAGMVAANGHYPSSHAGLSMTTPGGTNPANDFVLRSISPRALPPSHSLSPQQNKPLFPGQHFMQHNPASTAQQRGAALPPLTLSTTPSQRQQAFMNKQPSPLLFSATTPSASPHFLPTVPGGSPSPNPLTQMSLGMMQYQQASSQHYFPQQGGRSNGIPSTSRSAGLPDTSRSGGYAIPGTSKSGGAATSEITDRFQELGLPPPPPLPAHFYRQSSEDAGMLVDSQPLQQRRPWDPHHAHGQIMDDASMVATVGSGDMGYEDDNAAMDMSPVVEQPPIMDEFESPMKASSSTNMNGAQQQQQQQQQQPPANQQGGGGKFGLSSFGFGKKHKPWGIFGHGNANGNSVDAAPPPPPPAQEMPASTTMNSLKRTQSGSTTSSREYQQQQQQQPIVGGFAPSPPSVAANLDPKQQKKLQEKLRKENEKAKWEARDAANRERSRRVMEKRQQVIVEHEANKKSDFDWKSSAVGPGSLNNPGGAQPKERGKGVLKNGMANAPSASSSTQPMLGAPSNASLGPHRSPRGGAGMQPSASLLGMSPSELDEHGQWQPQPHRFVPNMHVHHDLSHHRNKARRRDADDDHSMSSVDMLSVSRFSMISRSTVDSDPGPGRPSRGHRTTGPYDLGRATSVSNLRAQNGVAGGSRPPGAKSTASLEQSFIAEFGQHGLGGGEQPQHRGPSPGHPGSSTMVSPPMQMLSLDGGPVAGAPSGILHRRSGSGSSRRLHGPAGSFLMNLPTLPPISSLHSPTFPTNSPGMASPSYEYGGNTNGNPMFPIMNHSQSAPPDQPSSETSLPPFSHIASFAEQSSQSLPPIVHHHHPNG